MAWVPRLTCASEPVYCARGNWIVFSMPDQERILYCEKVERPWKETETHQTNGKSPCVVYFKGEPVPYYFNSGWDRVRVLTQRVTQDF